MIYLTYYANQKFKHHTSNYDSLMNINMPVQDTVYKKTIYIPKPRLNQLTANMLRYVNKLYDKIDLMFELVTPYLENYEEQYETFKIPKHSGGLRTINSPKPEFKQILTRIKNILENELEVLTHNAAYAYTKNRCIKDALEKHQKNESKWYLKTDLTDFFSNCSPEFLYNQLIQVFPFCYIPEKYKTNEKFQKILKVCSLNNGLPQGTPTSPILTNLAMIPLDYQITEKLTRGTGEHYVYTRYADDMLISSKAKFDWSKLISEVLNPLLAPQFNIKHEKTRFGSTAGRNWNLGLMINKDNNITVGYKRKQRLNAMLNNFIRDYKGQPQIIWSKEDAIHLQGQISYLTQIEPTYAYHLIQKYNQKYNADYKSIMRTILRS